MEGGNHLTMHQQLVSPHVFGRYSFERRLQIETLNRAAQPNVATLPMPSLALPMMTSPRQPEMGFAQAFAKHHAESPRTQFSEGFAKHHAESPRTQFSEGAALFSPRVHYGIGGANSPRFHSHFNIGSGMGLKAGTRMGFGPPGSQWHCEEPSFKRF